MEQSGSIHTRVAGGAGRPGGTVRSIGRSSLVAMAAFAVACADAPPTEDLSADLKRDLELASGVGLELASAQGESQAVVSAIEVAPSPSVRRSPGLKPTPKAPPQPVVVPSVGSDVTENPTIALAEVPATVTDSSPVPVPEPTVASRPTPVSVSFPAETERGGGYGDGSGGIGVVIRGGGTGPDLCERHPRRGRPPVSINVRFPGPNVPGGPSRFPRTGGTFPR